ncbi:hypothetical protein KP79_PYT02203 [Mizuhopecten yessoensis]|uniref:Uncharacterized protein n=1 Tax=Mizuhopecten yessoensis TaxID=6573 RepID=A0A210PY65_MIZYE|nr:hypothetical protein KP79_PYT02203 [Mizuhopecten yessoensis]
MNNLIQMQSRSRLYTLKPEVIITVTRTIQSTTVDSMSHWEGDLLKTSTTNAKAERPGTKGYTSTQPMQGVLLIPENVKQPSVDKGAFNK